MRTILFCGGKGRRMFPFTSHPKCMLPIGNRPLLMHWLENLEILAMKNVTLFSSKKQARELRSLMNRFPFCEIIEAEENEVWEKLENLINEEDSYLLANGDSYITLNDLKCLKQSFDEKGNSLLLTKKDRANSTDTICAEAEEYVHVLYGHPRPHYVNADSCGVAMVNHLVLKHLRLTQYGFHKIPCGGMPNNSFYLEELLQNAIEQNVQINAVYAQEDFVNLDYPWDILKANTLYCKNVVANQETKIDASAVIGKSVRIRGNIQVKERSIIEDGAILEGNCVIGADVLIGAGCIIGNNCVIGDRTRVIHYAKLSDNTSVGHDVKVGFTAEISGVLFDYVAAAHNCEVYGVIGSYVDIAAGVQTAILRFDDQQVANSVLGKRHSSPYTNGVFIGDYCRTGISNLFYPGVKVGAQCALGPGLIVDEDISENQLVLAPKSEVIKKSWTSDRYGW